MAWARARAGDSGKIPTGGFGLREVKDDWTIETVSVNHARNSFLLESVLTQLKPVYKNIPEDVREKVHERTRRDLQALGLLPQ